MKQVLSFTLNGDRMETEIESHWTLLHLLRNPLGLTGTKEGCGKGECGACTVIVDGKAVNACLYPAMELEGKEVLTIEGLADAEGSLHPVQKALMEYGAVQCGFCTPGMVMSAIALLDENARPSEEEIRMAIAGNFCRCTGYIQIIEAIKAASRGR
jgi:carbon-monoxide dehydrogenase small subunit